MINTTIIEKKNVVYCLGGIVGSTMLLIFSAIDFMFYDSVKIELLTSRIIICLYLYIAAFIVYKAKDKYLDLIVILSFIITGLSVTYRIYTTGGFGSLYINELLFIIIICSGIIFLSPKKYLLSFGITLSIYLIVSFSLPFQNKNLILDVLVLVLVFTASFIFNLFFHNFQKKIKDLKELIPICMHCKKIRNDNEFWEQLEVYMDKVGYATSHSICPECLDKHYPDED